MLQGLGPTSAHGTEAAPSSGTPFFLWLLEHGWLSVLPATSSQVLLLGRRGGDTSFPCLDRPLSHLSPVFSVGFSRALVL